MTKDKIIELLSNLTTEKVPEYIIKKINELLYNYAEYEMNVEDNNIKINSILEDGKVGSYIEVNCKFDKETNNVILISTKKEYNPQFEVRAGFRQEVGMDLFTNSASYIYDNNGLLIYESSFRDDHKYYGGRGKDIEYTKEALPKYFADTTPKYDEGKVIDGPNSSYQPFSFVWERYGKTHVIKVTGRNPIKGEFGEIGITFDDKQLGDIKLLSEHNGYIYSPRQELKFETEQEIVDRIEELYQQANSVNKFDTHGFYDSFEESMFTGRRI